MLRQSCLVIFRVRRVAARYRQNAMGFEGLKSRLVIAPVIFLVCLGIICTTIGINQSSVGMYEFGQSQTATWGNDRPIRSDEWYVRLPWLMAQSNRGFPATLDSAGVHDASITYDLPVRSFQTLLKPHLIPYLFLSIDKAVAAEWWILVFGCIVSVYLLLLVLKVRPSIALPLAVLVATSPGLHWWTVNPSFDIIIFGSLGLCALLRALRCRSLISQSVLAVLAGWLFACSAVVLYPPFQIPTLVAVAAILIMKILDRKKYSSIVQVLVPVATTGIVFVSLILWFVLSHRAGLNQIASTVYPGSRRSNAGGVNVASLLGVPFDSRASGIVAGSVNRTNQSENASTFLLALPVLLMIPSLSKIVESGVLGRIFLILSGWFMLLMAWMVLPLPPIIGKLTLLDRVPPDRLKPSVALVSSLIVALFLEQFHDEIPLVRRLTSMLAFSVVTFWAGSQYVVNDVPLTRASIWLLGLLWLVPMCCMFMGLTRSGAVMLAIVSVWTSAQINPIHTSLSPIRKNELFAEIVRVDPSRDGSWITFTGTPQVRGVMVATGRRVESAVSPYPDPKFWSRFDPTGIYTDSWNRYAHVQMISSPGRTRITSPQPDVVTVVVDPCAVGSPILAGTFFVEASPDIVPCADVVSQVSYGDAEWFILQKD